MPSDAESRSQRKRQFTRQQQETLNLAARSASQLQCYPVLQPKEASKLCSMSCQNSIDTTYGVIIGQDTMRELKIDRNVLTNSITWDSLTTPMVPRGYWSHETIILNGEKLSQPPDLLNSVEASSKVLLNGEAEERFYTSTIIPSTTANCDEEDIVEMHKICKDLQSQSRSLSLKAQGRRGEKPVHSPRLNSN